MKTFTFHSHYVILCLILGVIHFNSSRGAPINSPSGIPVLVGSFLRERRDDCAPSRFSGTYVHDIACILETFDSFLYNQIQSDFECEKPSHGNSTSLPALYSSLIEVLSEFEMTELATQQMFNESLCMLKKIVVVGLNKTVRDYCNCRSCSIVPAQVSEISGDCLQHSTDDRCTLLSLRVILKKIGRVLNGTDVINSTCRRASSAQRQLLKNFTDIIQDQYDSVAPSDILQRIRLPPGSLCRYRGTPFDLSLHVESLYKLVPYLSELNSSEAQYLSESLSEDIFPVITELMVKQFGEDHVERLFNTSAPFSERMETTLATLSDQEKAICLIKRLSINYDQLMRTLQHRNFNIIIVPCT